VAALAKSTPPALQHIHFPSESPQYRRARSQGTGILNTAKLLSVGTATVARIKSEMAAPAE
jgi:hypothetical protein